MLHGSWRSKIENTESGLHGTGYIPNILGYAQISLSFMAMYYAFTSPLLTVGLWILSSAFDAIDGILARKLNQCSNFGILVSTSQRIFGKIV